MKTTNVLIGLLTVSVLLTSCGSTDAPPVVELPPALPGIELPLVTELGGGVTGFSEVLATGAASIGLADFNKVPLATDGSFTYPLPAPADMAKIAVPIDYSGNPACTGKVSSSNVSAKGLVVRGLNIYDAGKAVGSVRSFEEEKAETTSTGYTQKYSTNSFDYVDAPTTVSGKQVCRYIITTGPAKDYRYTINFDLNFQLKPGWNFLAYNFVSVVDDLAKTIVDTGTLSAGKPAIWSTYTTSELAPAVATVPAAATEPAAATVPATAGMPVGSSLRLSLASGVGQSAGGLAAGDLKMEPLGVGR